MNSWLKDMNSDYTLDQIIDALQDEKWLSENGITQLESECHYSDAIKASERVNDLACDWLDSHTLNEEWSSFLNFLEKNRGNESSCYTDTTHWCEGENFTSKELQFHIESLVGYKR